MRLAACALSMSSRFQFEIPVSSVLALACCVSRLSTLNRTNGNASRVCGRNILISNNRSDLYSDRSQTSDVIACACLELDACHMWQCYVTRSRIYVRWTAISVARHPSPDPSLLVVRSSTRDPARLCMSRLWSLVHLAPPHPSHTQARPAPCTGSYRPRGDGRA